VRPREAAAILEATADPVVFARQVLGHDPWPVAEDIMRSVAVPHSTTAVKACHASSKTFTAAELVLWWVYRMRGKAITTAPGFAQVERVMWPEIRTMAAKARVPLGGRVLQTEIQVEPEVYALGMSTDEGIRFQGFHGAVLLVIDEAPGMGAGILEAMEGIRAAGDVRMLFLGNPVLGGGSFQELFTSKRPAVKTFTIDAFDTPNLEGLTLDDIAAIPFGSNSTHPLLVPEVRPYLVTRRWVHEKFWTWGEASPLWQGRVRGQFPRQSEESLISLAWIDEASAKSEDTYDLSYPAMAGLDVAGPGDAETVLTIRQGPHVRQQLVWSTPDPRGEVIAALAPWDVQAVNVDAIGIGYYLARHLEDCGYEVNDINVGAKSMEADTYANLKAELYWALRERFRLGDISVPHDDTHISQLSSVRYKHTSRGQIVIESKEEARRRGVVSPDRAESTMLAFASPLGEQFELY
jgi:phage terminase large subunit